MQSVPGAPAPERHARQCRVVVSGEPGEEVTLDFFLKIVFAQLFF